MTRIDQLETKVSRESRCLNYLGSWWNWETMPDAAGWWIGGLGA